MNPNRLWPIYSNAGIYENDTLSFNKFHIPPVKFHNNGRESMVSSISHTSLKSHILSMAQNG